MAAEGARFGGVWRALAPGLVLSLIVGAWVAAHVSPDVPFDSDEANHANIALRQYQDLRDGLWADFVRHSYRTGQFPFLHGWMVVPWFAALGPSLFAARVAQTLLFVIGAGATAWAAWRAADDDPRAGAIAGSLFALSPAMATYSGLCMLEVPGAAMTALAIAVFAEACRATGRRALVLHALTAGAVLATYFTKLNYGLWIAPAIVAGHAVRALEPARRRQVLREVAVYLGVLLVVAAVWYSTHAQREAFRGFLHNPSQAVSIERDDPSFEVPGFHLGNLRAYPGFIVSDYHVHGLLGILVGACFLGGALRLRRPVVAASVACFAWTWLVLSMGFREYPSARFITSALGPFWIVAGVGAAALLARVGRTRSVAVAGAVVAAAGLFAQVRALPSLVAAEYEVGVEFRPVFDFIEKTVPPRSSVAVVNYTDHTSARTIEWTLANRPGTAFREHDVKAFIGERVFESPKRFHEWMTEPRPWGGADWASYVLEFRPGPRFPDRAALQADTMAMWRAAIAQYADRLEVAHEQRFEELDLTLLVWRDRSPPPHMGLSPAR